jgi:hypothetical protein
MRTHEYARVHMLIVWLPTVCHPFRFIVLPLQHSHLASLSLGILASFLMRQTSVHCISHSIQLLTHLSHFALVIRHLITQRTYDIIGRIQYIDHNAYKLEPSALVSCFHPTSDIDHLVVDSLHQTLYSLLFPPYTDPCTPGCTVSSNSSVGTVSRRLQSVSGRRLQPHKL